MLSIEHFRLDQSGMCAFQIEAGCNEWALSELLEKAAGIDSRKLAC